MDTKKVADFFTKLSEIGKKEARILLEGNKYYLMAAGFKINVTL